MTNETGLWSRLVSLGFRLLYREFARAYDAVAWLVSLGQWRAWGESALPYLTGDRILELGHGPGHLMVALTKQGFFPVGLDLSRQMSKIARRRLNRTGSDSHIVRGRAQTLPFPSGRFDSVVATFPTAYIADPATLAEVERILAPSGRVVIVLGAILTGDDPLSRLIEWLYRVTRQREVQNAQYWERTWLAAGLTTQQIEIEMQRSKVYLLVAERPTPRDIAGRNDG